MSDHDKPGEGAAGTAAKWKRGWPDGSGMEHILNENNEPLLTTWSMYAAEDGFKKPKKIEEDALDQAVRDHNSAAEARALIDSMQRVLADLKSNGVRSCACDMLADRIKTFLAGAPPDAK